MSKDLQLLLIPAYRTQHSQNWLVDTGISLYRDRNLEELIASLSLQIEPLARTTKISWENKEIQTDPYGDRLTYCLAGDFQKVSFPNNLNEWNQATFQYLTLLPENSFVIFYWL